MTILSKKAQIMGVINITPDSFSDGGNLLVSGNTDRPNLAKVIDHAALMIKEGVDWLDVGGESTRPGAVPVSVDQEMERVLPVIEALSARFDSLISVDTSQPLVIRSAFAAGAAMVNDVRALQLPGALQAATETGMAVCLMHMSGDPSSMQANPAYDSVGQEVYDFLQDRIRQACLSGIDLAKIAVDPGFGFGKSLAHNLQLLDSIPRFCELDCPVLVGFSRKSMIGAMTGRDTNEREAGTTMLNTLALQKGASIFRVHEVAHAADMIKIWRSIQNESVIQDEYKLEL